VGRRVAAREGTAATEKDAAAQGKAKAALSRDSEDFRHGTMALAFHPQEPAMPLLDHFAAPLNRTHPWRSFHGAWAAAMARLLNQGILPAGHYAVPLIDREGPIEIDVAALREHGAPLASDRGS